MEEAEQIVREESIAEEDEEEFPEKETSKKTTNPLLEFFKEDLLKIYCNPFWGIVLFLGVLLVLLFLLLFIELNQEQKYEELKGYVLIHHKIPQWYKDKVPDEISEIIKTHKQKIEKENADKLLEAPDPRLTNPTLTEFYPGKLSRTLVKSQKLVYCALN
jgi:hypothetical protein